MKVRDKSKTIIKTSVLWGIFARPPFLHKRALDSLRAPGGVRKRRKDNNACNSAGRRQAIGLRARRESIWCVWLSVCLSHLLPDCLTPTIFSILNAGVFFYTAKQVNPDRTISKRQSWFFCEKYFRALTIEWEKSLGGGEFRTPVAGTFVTQTQDQKADERLYKSTLPDMGCAVPWHMVLGTCCTW